jgi:molecular chaperone IbpA
MRNTLSLQSPIFDDLLRDINRFAVGFDPVWKSLDTVRHSSPSTGFPPYDLEKVGEHGYKLSMAVAGYGADDLEITQHDGILTVEGKVNSDETRTFLYKGIAGRSFKRSFCLNQWIKVTETALDNGILTVTFVQEIPEALKPKKIQINQPSTKIIDVE